MKVDWTLLSSVIAALSSIVSVIATVFIVRLTARYARSAELQAEAAIRQSSIASRSIEALDSQMREMHASQTANTVTVAVGVMVISKVWFRLIEYSPLPREPKLVLPALLEASQVSVQFSPIDAHRMRRIFEMLNIAEGELDVLRQLSQQQGAFAQEIRERFRTHLRVAHEEALRMLQNFAPEHVAEIETTLSLR